MADDPGAGRTGIEDAMMVIDAARQTFDMREIQNRRFMYNPDTCTLILGRQQSSRNLVSGSHAEDHGGSGTAEPYDNFLRGWIGTGRQYPRGVIHFAPPVDAKNPDSFVDGYNTLQMFRENGAGGDTVIRGFGDAWEQPLSAILPGFSQTNEKESEGPNMQHYGIWAVRSGASVLGSAETWSKRYGVPEVFTSKEAAGLQAEQYNKASASANVRYSVKAMEPELAADALRERAKLAPIVDEKKVYLYPADYARQHGELSLYQESNRLNRECATDIDLGINKRPEPNHLPPDLAEKLVAQYGLERINMVLANTVHQKEYDGRFSRDNKDWANTFPRLEKGRDCVADAHPVFVDGFIGMVRRLAAELSKQAERNSPTPEKVGSYVITRSILFDNNRGFAYGENPKAVQPFATWQITEDNGRRDHYWGHYHKEQEPALKDYENRVNEYMAEYPSLKVVVNPLAAAEMSTEQNYNMIDGILGNNLPPEPAPEPAAIPAQTSLTGRKFENVDVIEALGAVVERNTQGYKTDFNYDKEIIISAAQGSDPSDKTLLWLSRLNGTECCPERDAFIRETWGHNVWTYYDSSDQRLCAFAVEITGMVNGKVMGNLFELDHARHVQEVKKNVLPAETVLLTFKDGEQKRFPHAEYDGNFQRIQQTHGRVVYVRHDVKDDSALQAILKRQHDTRQRFPARSFAAYIKKLEPLEKPSVTERLKEAKQAVKPPAPGKSPSKSEPVL